MRIADKVFTSQVMKQAHAKRTVKEDEASATRKNASKDKAQQASQKAGQQGEPVLQSSINSHEIVDDLIRDRIAANDQKSGKGNDEAPLSAKVNDLSQADKLSVLSELKTREQSLEAVKKTNENLLTNRFVDFVA